LGVWFSPVGSPHPCRTSTAHLSHSSHSSPQLTSHIPLRLHHCADLRPSGAAFGHNEIKVPNIDRLASRGTTFTQAFCQAATCGVSRASLLTSRRPDTTRVLENGGCPFTSAPSHSVWQSLPEVFRHSGYTTAGMGKVFHPDVCDGAAVGERAQAWELPYYHAPCISLGSIYNGTCYEKWPGPLPMGPGGKVTSIYSNASVDAADNTMPDGMIADKAVQTLEQLSKSASEQPFFLAVGFHKVIPNWPPARCWRAHKRLPPCM